MTTLTAEARPATRAGLLAGAGLPWVLAVSLVLTGAAGLMYQVVWFRVLGQVFGVTVHATSAVLAAFMAGLALGSLMAAQITKRMSNPLRFYGLAEIVIGGFGVLSLVAFDLLQPVYVALAGSLGDANPALSPARFILALLIMLIPTTLMGATLPIVVTGAERASADMAKNVSLYYGANTFGAIAGAFTAGFYMIGTIGITNAVFVAASLNLLVGVAWFLLSLGPLKRTADQVAQDFEVREMIATAEQSFRLDKRTATMVLVSYCLSGAIALGAEVVWTRSLSGIFPGTTYSFSIMLCCVLAGIAFGSWAVNPFLRRRGNWLPVFIGLEISLGIFAALSLVTLGQAYAIEGAVRGLLGAQDYLTQRPLFMVFLAALVIGPSAFLMGVTFPVATKIFAAGHADIGRRVGLVYGANTVGAIVGALAGGLLLVPLLGAMLTMWVLAAGNIVAGIGVLLVAPWRARVKFAWGVAAVLGAGLVLQMTPGLYSQLFQTTVRGERVLWYQEGQDATVRVVQHPEGVRLLYINSEMQGASGGPAADFHHLIGHWGSLLHPNPQNVLVVGLGVGATPGAAALHPGGRIHLIELIPGVVGAAPWFQEVSYRVLERPNVDLEINDGRNHLLVTGQKYDIIQADPIQPMNAGANNLYSADFYRLARASLNEGGMMVQWVNNQLPDYAYRMMLRTFLDVFPNATLWHNGSIMVGTKDPIQVDPAALARKFEAPEVRASLASLGITSPGDVMQEFSAGPEQIRAFAGTGPILTDRTPFVEFFWTLPSNTPNQRPAEWNTSPLR